MYLEKDIMETIFSDSQNQAKHKTFQEDNEPQTNTASTKNFKERIMKIQMKSLTALLSPEVDISISKSTLLDIYNNRLSIIDSHRKELLKLVGSYFLDTNYNTELCDQIVQVIERASLYESDIREIYLKKEYHLKSQSLKLYEGLPRFSNEDDINIFDFLKRFDAIAEEFDIPLEKAEYLYSHFLSPSIQEEVVRYKNDYNSLRSILLQRYGNLKTIIHKLLVPIFNSKIPEQQDPAFLQLSYYRKLHFVFNNIHELLTSQNVPSTESQRLLFSNDFICNMLAYLPKEAELEFIKQLQQLGQNILLIQGKIAYKILISTVNRFFDMYDTSVRSKSEAIFNVRTHIARQDPCQLDNTIHCHEASIANPNSKISKKVRAVTLKSSKPVSKHRFPCIIKGHNHSIGECKEFFLLSPQQRAEYKKMFNSRYCILCLQSSEKCKFKNCANTEVVPSILKCRDCKLVSQTDDKQMYSILFCFSENHIKPTNDDVIKALELYVPKFELMHYRSSINIACHPKKFNCSRLPKSLTRVDGLNEPVSVYNTRIGSKESLADSDLILEPGEKSIQIMQLLNIEGKATLTMFDTGANQNLIDGEFAEKLNSNVYKSKPSKLSVISGSKIWTEYGEYKLALGPTQENKYFEIIAQGISSVTGTVELNNLSKVNGEVRSHTLVNDHTILPDYVGGDKVKLLIGLKTAHIQPILLFTLPSGLGVYKSPFTDIFGSDICYGGPHTSFSFQDKAKMNKTLWNT